MASCSPKQVSEPARERESFKYGASLLNDITDSPTEGAPPGQPSANGTVPSDEIKRQETPRDTVLASLAQLGLWKTGTDRALISLFDRNHQYIVAETTQRSSLAKSPIRPKDRNGDFWLYPGTFSRRLSVCGRALMAQSHDSSSSDKELPLTLIPDLKADARLCKIQHPLSEFPARFYAAVPVRSPTGVDIGVYCVIDSEPREAESWTTNDTEVLREISSNIMDYLRSKSVGDAYRRSVRMTRGIGSFVEKESSMASWRARTNSPAFHDDATREGNLNSEQQALQQFRDISLQKTLPVHVPMQPNTTGETTAISSGGPGEANMTSTSSKSMSVRESDANAKEKSIAKIFSRAANLIREGIEIEGVVFLDANFETSATDSMLHEGQSSTESSSNSDESTALLRRYPAGKIFNFDEDGSLLSSGSSEADLCTPMPKQEYFGEGSTAALSGKSQRPWSRSLEGPSVSKIFPGARSVAFVPVWDPKRDRWLAGGFAYTRTPTRTFTIEGELSYLRGFGMLAMSEAQRLEALLVNKAQSDVLGSLSHELRTPLHGVMLSAELLSDTQLDVFQGNLLRTLETCGRTLSETIDHLLYFSKVNQVAAHRKKERRARKRSIVSDSATTVPASVSTSEVRLDALIEEVMDSVFAGHVFKGNEAQKAWQTANRSKRVNTEDENDLTGGHQVAIFLDIDPYVPYRFHVAAGALRRVVMNLFGNALKYTHKGTITVALSQKPLSSNNPSSYRRLVRISVTDTGQGISPDFLRNDLFKPFSQENHLSHGTGLGLSLVKKIVASMGGKISIESEVNVGTTATVTLPLLRSKDSDSSNLGQEKNEVDEETKRLKGLRLRLVGFPSEEEIKSNTGRGIPMSAMKVMCHRWLEMDVINEAKCQEVAPDLVLCNEIAIKDPVLSSEELVRCPVVVVCANAITAHKRSSESKASENQRVYEFVSQPIGPHKLARILHIALCRWGDLQALSPAVPVEGDAPDDKSTPGPGAASLKRPGPPSRVPSKRPPQATQQQGSTATSEPKSFLLVDDNPINLSVLCAYMKKLKTKYTTAADGLEAVERFQENPDEFSCILMDITSAQQEAYASGVDVFLSKPVKLKELSSILRERSLA
ncbi:Hybrid signal transduction histidine kinase B [Fusarium oxysporum f. sp. cubense race 1]|uniref:histidine kinase n=1 Tax=Fusarium oxysporum f. sp. cubense (strain race 1) TaxID=1229664 RepID=N4TZX7_FUSC1|nr:Hybrid signal transduction histidine kinase B [Fusarium oxysporum f. sp. cubense race 1]